MTVDRCRVCGNNFFDTPLLAYRNMPKAAQYLPDEATRYLDEGMELIVCQCRSCGLVQLKNDPVPYFREVIRAAGISEEMSIFRLNQFNELIEKFSLGGKRIIEIGCGKGEYLSILQNLEINAHGLEHSLESVNHCIKCGLNVKKGFVESENEKVPGGPFDAFFTFNFFEHLPDPNTTLKGICHNLTDDAIGIIEVPNFDMICRKKIFSEFIQDHLLYFTKETLVATLNRNGFEIIDCHEIWYDYIISVIVRKRQPLDLSSFSRIQERMKEEIEAYLDRFKYKNVAIWGAGHQAFAVISLAQLSDKIKYVVDSAEFKQGKLTPASHIPIVPPSRLYEDPVDAVIIMAAGYSDEVSGIIQKKHQRDIHVAILRDFGLQEII